jgi:hypothetical protein
MSKSTEGTEFRVRAIDAAGGNQICPTRAIPKSTKRKGADGRPINLANMDKCDTPRGVQGSLRLRGFLSRTAL